MSGAGHALGNRHEVHLGIRPHLVAIGGGGALRGQVVSNQWLGDQTHIATDFAGASLVLVEHDRARLARGETIHVTIAPEDLHVFDRDTGRAISHGFEVAR